MANETSNETTSEITTDTISETTSKTTEQTKIQLSADGTQLLCAGAWTLPSISLLTVALHALSKSMEKVTQVDAAGITQMDSAGALMLSDVLENFSGWTLDQCKKSDEGTLASPAATVSTPINANVQGLKGLKNKFHALFTLVSDETKRCRMRQAPPKKQGNYFYRVGFWTFNKYHDLLSFFAFIGELVMAILQSIRKPSSIQWRAVLKIVDEAGYRALPVIALMLFLVGVVLAYQLGVELKVYGADIFVVDVSGMAILREFGPLIAAIIMAGRTSTAFTALIGTMKVNEEIDALNTMGISPIQRLVLPRIFGLIIAIPLLTVCADIFGIAGSMVMTKVVIHINYHAFLIRFQQMVALKQFVLGIIKTPIFALIIATVGCYQGFQTELDAESVGRRTTTAAVHAIFLIIVVDASFSILYSVLGL